MENVITREYIDGYAHGKRNFRLGIGYPRGFRDLDTGIRGEPHTAFRSLHYGKGYCQGWAELASKTPGGEALIRRTMQANEAAEGVVR